MAISDDTRASVDSADHAADAANVPDELTDLASEYDILGELGRGGSAIVYRARDRDLNREVAIKVVRPRHGAADDEALTRLSREARTVAQLHHARIVTVYAVKRLHDGGLALVMQLVPGLTLKQAIYADGQFPPERAERVIRDVAEALAYAHSHGVVHRDVKPENIFLEEGTDRALLSDFGIAHSAEFDSRLTMTGTAIGTPAYMSPEQIDGAPADVRSDVYSLGLVAWEMLTGERPWEGESLYNVIFRQKHDQLPSIDEFRDDVPPRLQYIIERMLQKKPAARWAGADGLLAHLNSSVMPSDWKQWQDAHRRRRDRAKREAAHGAKQGVIAAALATVRFRRPENGADASEVAHISTPVAIATTAVDDANDDAPSWVTDAPPPPRYRRAMIAGLLVVVTGAAFASYALRDQGSRTSSVPPQLNDVARVQVPVTPSLDSQLAPRVDSIAGTLGADSTALRSLATGTQAAPPVSPAMPPAAATTPPVSAVNSRVPGRLPALRYPSSRPVPDSTVITQTPVRASANTSATRGAIASPPSTASSPAPDNVVTVRATDDRGVIAAGGRHTCWIGTGHVQCWGANDRGQLGDGEQEARALPREIVGDIDFTQVSAGIAHSCGVARGGDAYCWGSDEFGQLGDATTTSRSAPVQVVGNMSFRIVRTGRDHTCGLTTSGDVACWGSNEFGQLGDGTTTNRSAPVRINASGRFIAIATGWRHSCALSTEGIAFCWGQNSNAQLGDGSRTDRRVPTPVAGLIRFTSIAAGSTHTCAVSDAGEAYCWGKNEFGQLGVGGTGDHPTPSRVDSPARFVSITTGSVHSCARTASAMVFCWGRNTYGQLGDGTTTNRDTPSRVAGPSFSTVSATGAHTCGMTTDGDAVCWGYNVDGQLGDGSRNHRLRPTRVAAAGR